jgi:DNA-binding NtrC family response regulator
VFVDNRLPGIQGIEVIKRIKAVHEEALIVFMTAYGSIDVAVKAIKMGATEYISKPFDFKEIQTLLGNLKEKINMKNEVQLLRRQQNTNVTFDHIIGESALMKKLVQEAKKISKINTTTVLLLGESGTGKDQFARAIHFDSARNAKPFVTINCSTLSESLLESELFGHEQGAFTDARKMKKGMFEMAEGGTIFLDEIGEINHSIQVKLLGVIENRSVRRVGGTIDIPVNIRIIAATNKDLANSIRERTFREDLYYRLKVFQIWMPPLREHKDDIIHLADHFILLFNSQFGKKIGGLSADVKKILESYSWPGNIRELKNIIERAVILENSAVLQPESLPGEMVSLHQEGAPFINTTALTPGEVAPITSGGVSLYEVEKETILRALEQSGHNQSKAARILEITRDTLRYKMKKYKL